MDIKTKAQRSYNMSRVRSRNTKPELIFFKILKENRYKFRKHYKIVGSPDVAFPKQNVAVFINGEFWHGKDYRKIKNKIPKFWKTKIGINIKRDRKVRSELRKRNWRTINFWGRTVVKNPEAALKRLQRFLDKS